MHSTVAMPAYANDRISCAPKSSNAVVQLPHSHVKSYSARSGLGLLDKLILNSVISGTMKNTNRNNIPGSTSAYGIFLPDRSDRLSVAVTAAIGHDPVSAKNASVMRVSTSWGSVANTLRR